MNAKIANISGENMSLFRKLLQNSGASKIGISTTTRDSECIIQCPYCGSTSTIKITTLERGASIVAFGLASGKVGKQWHCNNCKSDF